MARTPKSEASLDTRVAPAPEELAQAFEQPPVATDAVTPQAPTMALDLSDFDKALASLDDTVEAVGAKIVTVVEEVVEEVVELSEKTRLEMALGAERVKHYAERATKVVEDVLEG